MNRDKQIKEMTNVYEDARTKSIETLGSMNEGAGVWYAKAFYTAGYRKASDVAEDIIRMLRAGGINEWRYPIVADIKKKYTEDEG